MIIDLQRMVVAWANGISPGRRPKDAVVKMVSETSELLDAVLNGDRRDVEGELGDCIILLLDIADMYGIDIVQAGLDKMEVNKKRDWVAKNGVIRRKKGNGASNGSQRQTQTDAGQTVPDLPREPGPIGRRT